MHKSACLTTFPNQPPPPFPVTYKVNFAALKKTFFGPEAITVS